jgi:hypothetical protein
MTLFILATLLLLPSATPSGDLAVGGRWGAKRQSPARRDSGSEVRSAIRRNVRFQLCSSDGQPLAQQVNIALTVEPLTSGAASGIVAVEGITTDRTGRFSVAYAGGGWRTGETSRELHYFSIDGRVIAAFVLERGPETVEFTRAPDDLSLLRKNLQDSGGDRDYP